MRAALELLRLCTERFPPRVGTAHALTWCDGRLRLSIVLEATWQSFDLDEADMVASPESLVEAIVGAMPAEGRPVPVA